MQQRLVELEERLANDRDGSLRAALVAELTQARESLRPRLAQGSTQEQYRRWAAAERALSAAIVVLEKVRIEPQAARADGPASGFQPADLKGE